MHFIERGPICMYLVVWNLFYYEEMYLNGILYLLVLKFCFVSTGYAGIHAILNYPDLFFRHSLDTACMGIKPC